jgi:DNA-binding GntR family transcriptional regulator
MDLTGFATVSHTSLSSETAGALREAIMEGALEPGQRIVESAVAEHFGVSRAPVREAIMELQKQGLVRIVPRKGAFVVKWTLQDLWEIYTLRQALEGLAARLAAEVITPEQKQKLQDIVDQIRAHSGSDRESTVALDLQFHTELCAVAGHARLQETLMSNHLQTEVYIRNTSGLVEFESEGFSEGHQAILDAVCSGDPEEAERVMRAHIGPDDLDSWRER